MDDVMTSATINPSVPAVVFEVVTEFVASGSSGDSAVKREEEEEEDEEKGETLEYSENDISDIIDSELDKEVEVSSKIDAEQQRSGDEQEVQEVKIQEKEGEEEGKEEPKVITFGGKPVPETGVVVINGYATAVQDASKATEASPAPDSSVAKRQSAIPQTDLDTFETRLTSEHGSMQDLDVSNPDDDGSDRKSDTASVNTLDSIEKEPEAEPSTTVVQRRKGNIRPRNVSDMFGFVLHFSVFSHFHCSWATWRSVQIVQVLLAA